MPMYIIIVIIVFRPEKPIYSFNVLLFNLQLIF